MGKNTKAGKFKMAKAKNEMVIGRKKKKIKMVDKENAKIKSWKKNHHKTK